MLRACACALSPYDACCKAKRPLTGTGQARFFGRLLAMSLLWDECHGSSLAHAVRPRPFPLLRPRPFPLLHRLGIPPLCPNARDGRKAHVGTTIQGTHINFSLSNAKEMLLGDSLDANALGCGSVGSTCGRACTKQRSTTPPSLRRASKQRQWLLKKRRAQLEWWERAQAQVPAMLHLQRA